MLLSKSIHVLYENTCMRLCTLMGKNIHALQFHKNKSYGKLINGHVKMHFTPLIKVVVPKCKFTVEREGNVRNRFTSPWGYPVLF